MYKRQLFFLFLSTVALAQNTEANKVQINSVLDNWHLAASKDNFNDYFNVLTEDAIYIGTDATENWTKPQFEAFAKPYCDLSLIHI